MRLDRGAHAYTAMELAPDNSEDVDDDELLHATDGFADLCLIEKPSPLQGLKKWIGQLASAPSTTAVLLVLLLNQFLFSTMHTISHAALEHIPPLVFACFRFVLSLPFLALIAHMERSSWTRLMGKDVEITPRVAYWTMGCSLMGVAGAQMLVLLGNNLAGPSITAITQPGIPVYTALIAALVGVEKLSPAKISGVLLAVGGAVVLLHPWTMLASQESAQEAEMEQVGSTKTIGTIVMLLQTLSYAIFMVMFSSFLQWFPHPFTAFFLCTLWAAIFQVVICLPTFSSFSWGEVPFSAWGAVAYCAFVISFVAHTGQAWAIKHLRPTIPSLFVCLQPPLTIVMAVLLLGEELELWTDLGGMGLILLGMVIVILAKNQEAASPSADGNAAQSRGKRWRGAARSTSGYGQLQPIDEDGGEEREPGLVLGSDVEWEEGDGVVQEAGKGAMDVEMAEFKAKVAIKNRDQSGMPLEDPFNTPMCIASNLRANSLTLDGNVIPMQNVRSADSLNSQGSFRISSAPGVMPN